jgi:hypothetical protein
MNLIERAKKMTLSPQSEWGIVAQENTTTAALYKSYIVPLSAISPIASFIGLSIVGISLPFMGSMRVPFVSGLTHMVVSYLLSLVGVFLIALLINALAPTFSGQKNQLQALKVAAFAFTPVWIASVLQILPSLSILVLLAGLYSLYVLYLGLPVLMKSPKEKALGYTAVVVVCAIVLTIVFGVIAKSVLGIGDGMQPDAGGPSMQFGKAGDGNDAMAKLQQMSERMDAANKKMEAAKLSGDPQAQAEAARAALGAVMGGQYEPVDQRILKDLLPEVLGNLKRTKSESNKAAMGDFKIAKAEAGYGDGQNHNIDLTLTDTGGAQMFGALAAWSVMENERENDSGYEKMIKVDGRPVHEKFNKNDMNGEYSVIVAGRFLVEAHGQQVEMAALKQAVAAVNFNKLESMKNEGAKK